VSTTQGFFFAPSPLYNAIVLFRKSECKNGNFRRWPHQYNEIEEHDQAQSGRSIRPIYPRDASVSPCSSSFPVENKNTLIYFNLFFLLDLLLCAISILQIDPNDPRNSHLLEVLNSSKDIGYDQLLFDPLQYSLVLGKYPAHRQLSFLQRVV
jgi:hypothetical protein